RLADVVRHEDRRLPDLPSQREELALQLDAGDRVQRAERLVEEQDRRVGRQRAGDADTLALAPGELTRVAGGELRGRQLDLLEQGVRAGADLLGGPAFQARHEGDVLERHEGRHEVAAGGAAIKRFSAKGHSLSTHCASHTKPARAAMPGISSTRYLWQASVQMVSSFLSVQVNSASRIDTDCRRF